MNRTYIVVALLVGLVTAIFVAAHAGARWHAQSVMCGNSMLSLEAAARRWADGHDGHLPADWQAVSNELQTTAILICPGDHERQPAANWASLTSNNCSYEIVGRGLTLTSTNAVFMRCKVHGFEGYGDGSVFDGGRKITKNLW